MKKTLALLAFAIISIGSISAQSMQDVVYLKNGSIIRGMVIEIVSDGNVKVQTADGCVFVYPMTDVQKIQKKSKKSKTNRCLDIINIPIILILPKNAMMSSMVGEMLHASVAS